MRQHSPCRSGRRIDVAVARQREMRMEFRRPLPPWAMNIIELLTWRYATKKMDPSRTVPQDKVDRIVEAARLAPTSSGLQPFEIISVTNPEVRAQIREIAWNQAQITPSDGSPSHGCHRAFKVRSMAQSCRPAAWREYRQPTQTDLTTSGIAGPKAAVGRRAQQDCR
jgi:hypothetical protein